VRAPDGSLIYLVDQDADVYGTDFNLQPNALASGGLKRIDHMAMALPADSLDSWVLFYKSLLDFEADDEVVLPDPYGLVKSRALRSRDSSIRLPLNISENRNTAISHALSSYRGSGVHHIAFDCDDIFAEVSRAKEAGVPLLDIPLNYYDDLAARFDFDDEFLSELAYYNVLYDRDAQGGELFHVHRAVRRAVFLRDHPAQERLCRLRRGQRRGTSGGDGQIAQRCGASGEVVGNS
jgi:4-hydroxyphenylpyruvate dioxygenase